eukprot:scaffold9344_cov59-Cylindrotheca_fusiformis.AAC.1
MQNANYSSNANKKVLTTTLVNWADGDRTGGPIWQHQTGNSAETRRRWSWSSPVANNAYLGHQHWQHFSFGLKGVVCDHVQDSRQPRAWIESVGLIDSAWSEGHRGVSTQGADGVRAMEMADRGLIVIKFESSYGVRLDDYHPWRNGDDIQSRETVDNNDVVKQAGY